MAASFMHCILSSSSRREDSTEVVAETPHIVQHPAHPVKEELKGEGGPITEPANFIKVSPKPAALVLDQLVPSKPSGGGDGEKPTDVQKSFDKKEPVYPAEKQLWATVEETTAEGGEKRSEEKIEKQQEGGVRGG